MKGALQHILLTTVIGLLMTACAATNGGGTYMNEAGGDTMQSGTLESSGFFEACEDVTAGQLVGYSFTASGPVDFDVHYHVDDGKAYPVKENNITSQQGEFRAKVTKIYCLMWKNRQAAPVNLEYEFTVTD